MSGQITGMEDLSSLVINLDQARSIYQNETKSEKKKADPRFWKPSIKNNTKSYEAKIRLVPQGDAFLSNPLIPWAVEQHTHWIKEKEHGLTLVTKCRKTLGSQEKCPICEYNWNMYNAAKKRNDQLIMDKMTDRKSRISYIGNILVLEDLNHPELNGTVKLWEHTKNINNMLMEHFPGRINKAKEGPPQETNSFKKAKIVENFVPWDVVQGKNYFVIVGEDDKKMATYSESYWDEDGLSPLALTRAEILEILSKTHNLKEFVEDVPSVEELSRRFEQFNDKLNDLSGASSSGAVSQASLQSHQDAAVSKGNASELLAAAVKSTPVTTPVPTQQPAPTQPSFTQQPVVETDDSDDDDLPF
jgi:antitoxin component HigA of HigAB toxin-antitoxin module